MNDAYNRRIVGQCDNMKCPRINDVRQQYTLPPWVLQALVDVTEVGWGEGMVNDVYQHWRGNGAGYFTLVTGAGSSKI